MNTAAIWTFDDKGKATLVLGPDSPVDAVRARFKKMRIENHDGDGKLVRVEYWDAVRGRRQRKSWNPGVSVMPQAKIEKKK